MLLILNSILRNLCQWITELEQSGQTDITQILTYSEKVIKDKLKTIRGDSIPSPKSLVLETDISTDTELDRIRNQCVDYVARFERMLSSYELERQVDEPEYNQFIFQLIKDRLFNNVAGFIPFDTLSEKMAPFLQLVDWEIVPIEIGETEVDARVHDVQDSRQTRVKPGTVAKVVLPGLMRKTDSIIVQKPVVIRGE